MKRLTQMRAKKILRTSKVRFTGNKREMLSPLTGRLTIYYETMHIQVSQHITQTIDLDALQNSINNDFQTHSMDAMCDGILLIQGALQDTFKPRVWVAATPAQAKAGKQALFDPGTISLIVWAILIITAIIAAVYIVTMFSNSFATITKWFLQPPTYVGGNDPNNPKTYDTWAAYLSAQHLYYWYVCPKCGAGFGSKTKYPNIEDVPAEEKAAYDEHVNICLGIPQGPQNVVDYLVWVALLVGGGIVVLFVIREVTASHPASYPAAPVPAPTW